MSNAIITSTSEGVTLTATIPLEAFQKAVAGCYGYQETINGEANPESRGVYAFKQVINVLKSWAHNNVAQELTEEFNVDVGIEVSQ
jgi:hypothetical protein